MKKILYLLVIVAAFFPTACADLDENPVGVLAPESFFQSTQDARAAMDGAYARITQEPYYGRQLTMTLDFLSDEVAIGNLGTTANRLEMNEFRVDPQNGIISTFWPNLYSAISAANLVVDRTSVMENISDAQRAAIVGEAKFVRALTYYHLVRLFGAIPYVDVFVSDPSTVANIERTPEADVYNKIIKDLEDAIAGLPTSYPGNVKSRATKGAAQSLLADVYLTRKEYGKAADLAKQVISSGTFSLVDDFADLYDVDKQDTREHIFTVDFAAGLSQGNYNDDLNTSMTAVRGADLNGFGVSVPSMKVFESFDNRDYRKEVSFYDSVLVKGKLVPYTQFPNEKRPHIAKWIRWVGAKAQSDGRNSDQNYPVLRYAEVLLIAAEALNEANGPTAEALGYLNQVRARARKGGRLGAPSAFPADIQSGLTKEQFRDAVLEERRIELAFEWKRWYDLVRTDRFIEAFTGPNSLEPQPRIQPHHRYLPIPQIEIDRNPKLTQNPGY